jgi:gliding motility-associated-like protein
MRRFILAFLIACFSGFVAKGQIEIDTTLTPEQLVQEVLLGAGVSVSNITFNGQPADQLNAQIGRMSGTSAFIEFPEAVVMRTGHTEIIEDPTFFPPFGTFPPVQISDDPDLLEISGQNNVNDCAILEFDFVPTGDSLVFRYVFASNEYPSFTCSGFNDAFGFFISGPGITGPFTDNAINIALVPDTDIPVAINTINSGVSSAPGNEPNCEAANPNWVEDSQYFVSNEPIAEGDVQFPGMTVTLTAFAEVICGEEYHIKLAIGDALDGALDSGVFLEAGSFTSNSAIQIDLSVSTGLNDSTLYEGCGEVELLFIRPEENNAVEATADLAYSGTAIQGIDFVPALPDVVVFPPGVDTVAFYLTAPSDAQFEGQETATFQITNVASECAGAILTSEFTFYLNEAEPLEATGFDGALTDCNDEIEIYPTVTGGYGEYSYQWSNGMSGDTITVSPGISTTLFVTVSDTCDAGSATTNFDIEVPVYPPIVVDLGDDFEVAECDVTASLAPTAEGGFGSYTYTWLANGQVVGNGPTIDYFVEQTTILEVVVTDECELSGSDAVTITVPEVEVTAVLPDIFSAESCLDDIILPAISDGGIGVKSYNWYVDGELIETTLLTYFTYNPSMGQNVTLIAVDECLNQGIDSTFISFNFPEVEVEIFGESAVCPGEETFLAVDISGGSGNFNIVWQGSDTTDVYQFAPEATANYRVLVTDTCGVSAEDGFNVEVREVRADFDYTYIEYYGLDLKNLSRGINLSYEWDFGDGNTSTEKDPRHYYTEIDPFFIELAAIDDIGCRDTIGLTTIPPTAIFIPTSFTPNGDGVNDLFFAQGANIEEFEMRIFDRWGDLVFESFDIDTKWDGSVNGGDYFGANAVYNYIIKYRGEEDEDFTERTGFITITR